MFTTPKAVSRIVAGAKALGRFVGDALAAAFRLIFPVGGMIQLPEEWRMSGYGDSIEFEIEARTTEATWFFLASEGVKLTFLRYLGLAAGNFTDVAGASGSVVTGEPFAPNKKHRVRIDYLNGGPVLTLNGVPGAASISEIDILHPDNRVKNIGAASVFTGMAKNLRLTNITSLQNRKAVDMSADGVMAVKLPRIVLTGAFEIEFDWVRQDATGTGQSCLIGEGNDNRLIVADTGHGQADRVTLVIGGVSYYFTAALANIALGQHCRIKLARDASNLWTLTVDRTKVISGSTVAGDFPVTLLGKFAGTSGNAGIYGDVKIVDKAGPSDISYLFDMSGDGQIVTDNLTFDVAENLDPVSSIGADLMGTEALVLPNAWTDNGDGSFTKTPGASSGLLFTGLLTEGEWYIVEYEMFGRVAGGVIAYGGQGGGFNSGSQTSNGVTRRLVQASSAAATPEVLQLFATSAFEGGIRNITCTPVTAGIWENYDRATDQVDMPQLSRHYKLDDGPDAPYAADKLNPPVALFEFTDEFSTWSKWSSGTPPTLDAAGNFSFPGALSAEQISFSDSGDGTEKLFAAEIEIKADPGDAGKQLRIGIAGNGPDYQMQNHAVTLTEQWQKVRAPAHRGAGLDWSNGVRLQVQNLGSPNAVSGQIRNAKLLDCEGQGELINIDANDWE